MVGPGLCVISRTVGWPAGCEEVGVVAFDVAASNSARLAMSVIFVVADVVDIVWWACMG